MAIWQVLVLVIAWIATATIIGTGWHFKRSGNQVPKKALPLLAGFDHAATNLMVR